MNKLLQRLLVVGILTVSVPLSLVWASKRSCYYHGCAGTGTYQLISDKDNANVFSKTYMDSLRVVIQARRDREKEVVIQITPKTSVRILPENEILKPDFVPVDEFVFVDRQVKRVSNRR